jgi:hypothetical protein
MGDVLYSPFFKLYKIVIKSIVVNKKIKE